MPKLGSLKIALFLIAGLVLVAGAYFVLSRESEPSLFPEKQPVRAVVGDFENLTGEPLLDDSLDIAFRAGLEPSRRLEIVSDGRIRDALARLRHEPATPVLRDLGVEIGRQENAIAYIGGKITKQGSSYALSVEIVDTGTGDRLAELRQEAEGKGEILSALQTLVRDLRRRL